MLIPQLIVRDVAEAIAFLTQVLDFTPGLAMPESDPFYAIVMRGEDELHLQRAPADKAAGAGAAIIVCADVDALFAAFVARGLAVPDRPDSPVHCGPVDQSWGTREVYIADPSGNMLIYQQR